MTSQPVFFNDAILIIADLIANTQIPVDMKPLVVRDLHGRIRIALKIKRKNAVALDALLNAGLAQLGSFVGEGTHRVLFSDDFFDPDAVFESPDILNFYLPGQALPIRVLDRQIVGQDWLRPSIMLQNSIPRIAFFGLKGGVGRSTALAMLAYQLAQNGKRVLLIDFDLESPGLSSLLLPPNHLADFGVIDWFIEDAVGQDALVLERMIAVSPLSEQTQGEIRIAAAMGRKENFYLTKLSRAYADVSRDGRLERFAERAQRLLMALEQQERPDVILIDSRAGLNDLAAISIVSLATLALLFATDTAQSWEGYRLLFSHWQAYPDILRAVRDRLVMIEALFPESDQTARIKKFLEHSYSLFAATLYEEIEADQPSNPDIFNFDLNDQLAPHYPLRIKWNNRFQEFSPLTLAEGILTDIDIAATFGDFLDGMQQLIKMAVYDSSER
jgi:cellulose biosynthesis protein BcsQ